MEEPVTDLAVAEGALDRALADALAALVAMREREGRALEADLSARLQRVATLAGEVAALAPRTVEAYRARIQERVADLLKGAPVDEGRLVQEVALFAERTDVAEEATRLQAHLEAFRGFLASSEPAGRRMDFLVQEMHREVNTTGSKSQSTGDLHPHRRAQGRARADPRAGPERRMSTVPLHRGLLLVLSAPSGSGEDDAGPPLRGCPSRGGLQRQHDHPRAPRRRAGRGRLPLRRRAHLPADDRAGRVRRVGRGARQLLRQPARGGGPGVRATGGIAVFDIDVQGGQSIQRRYPEAVLVFVLPPTMAELERRLRERGTESEDAIRRRMLAARSELELGARAYDYLVVNDAWSGPTPSSNPSSPPSAAGGRGWTSPPSGSRDRSEAVDTAGRSLYLARPSLRSARDSGTARGAVAVAGGGLLTSGSGRGGGQGKNHESNLRLTGIRPAAV